VVNISDVEIYLRAEDIPTDGLIVQVKGRILLIPAEESRYNIPKLEIDVKLPNDTTKTWRANMTSMRNIASIHGDNTDQWQNKYVKLKVETRKIRGNTMPVIFGYPVSSSACPTQ
jgi:hypothetical protein